MAAVAVLGTAAAVAAPPAGASGAAATFTVTGFTDGAGSCDSVPDASGNVACTTLRAAVNRANLQSNSPTIYLSAGTYQLTLAGGGQLAMGAYTIQGAGPGGPGGTTIQQTDDQNRVIIVQAGPAKLTGVEVTGGHLAPTSWTACSTEPWEGGGILAQGPLVLQNDLVSDNQILAPTGSSGSTGACAEGGGIAYASGIAAGSMITNSTITGNTATGGAGGTGGGPGGAASGGGIAYQGSGPLIIEDSTISSNAATGGAGGGGASSGGTGGTAEGGGIFNGADMTLAGTTVAANTVTGGAQGPGSPSATNLGGNGDGGGIETTQATDTLVNSTLFGNAAQGGGASTPAKDGFGVAGGLGRTGSTGGLGLASDTFDANVADSAASVFADVPTPPTGFAVHDTIFAAGATQAANCEFFPPSQPIADESRNLEDDSAGTCGLTAAHQDLVGVNPELRSGLNSNGGPTQTLAPAPGSPILGAGGQCLDPTSTPPNQALALDQRNEPRTGTCDIGAFQGQRPQNTSPPVITGTARRGDALTCSQGTWLGDGALQYAFTWLRNGVTIPGAATSGYVVTAHDAGAALACRVTATYYGSVAAASALITVPGNPLITLLRVMARGATVAVDLGCRGSAGQRCTGLLKLVGVEQVRRGRVVAVIAASIQRPRVVGLGQHRYTIAARHTGTVVLALNRIGARLLQRFRKLPVTLGVSQTIATGTNVVSTRLLTIRLNQRRQARRRT